MDITTLLFTMAYILMADGKPQSFIPRDRQYNQNEDASNEFGDHLAIDVKDDNKTIDIDVGNALENLLYDLQNMNLDNNTQTIGDSPISNDFDNENLEHDEMPESMFASGTIENLISIVDSDEDDELDDEPFTVAERVENLISITDSDEDINDAEVDADDELDDGPFTVAERVDNAATNPIPNAEIEDTALSQKHKSILIGRITSNPSTNYIDSLISNADIDGIELSEKHKSMMGRTTANPASIYIDGTDFDNTIAEPISDTDVDGIVIATPEQISNTGVEGIDIAVDDIAATEPLFDDEDSIDIAYAESILDANIDVIDNTTTDLISDADGIVSATTVAVTNIDVDGIDILTPEPVSEADVSIIDTTLVESVLNASVDGKIDDTTSEPKSDADVDGIDIGTPEPVIYADVDESIITATELILDTGVDIKTAELLSDADSDVNDITTPVPVSNVDVDDIDISSTQQVSDADLEGVDIALTEPVSYDVDGFQVSEKHKSMVGSTPTNPLLNTSVNSDGSTAEPISDSDSEGIELSKKHKSMLIGNTTENSAPNSEDGIDSTFVQPISETAELISDSEFNGFELSEKHKSMLISSSTTNLTANSDDIDTTNVEPISDSYSDSIELSEKHKSVLKGSIIENPDPNSEDDIDSIFVQPISEVANSDDIDTTVEPISDADIDSIELSEKHKSMLIESTSKSVNDTTTEERILDAADPPGPGGPLVPGAGGSEMNPVGPGNPPADGAGIVPQTPIVNFAAVTNYSASAPGDEVCEGKYARGTETGRCVFPFEYAGQSHCDCLPRIFVVFDLPWTWCPTTVTNGVIDAWDHCIDTYTVRGSKCIFPFVSDNDEYNDCANSTDKPYCATSLRTNGITLDTWEVCADAWTEK